MTLSELYLMLLIGGTVLLASIAAARAAHRIGLPSLLLFLCVGLVAGEDGLGLRFDDAQLAQALGAAALALILVEGGLTTQWSDVRRLLAPAGVLATAGVAVSVVVTAAGAHWLLGLDWRLALLIGAIVSSTDAAAVFAVLRALPLPRRVSVLVEAESGFNDAPTIILVLLFSTTADLPGPGPVMGNLLYQLVVGGVLGVVIGRLGVAALRHIALPATGLYPLATVGFGVVAFAAAGALNASGIIAAYLSGLVLGNSKLPHRAATRSFAEGVGWLAQIGLFVMLGLLVDPTELPAAILPALVVGLVLLLVARPVSVLLCLLPFRVPWREQVFISWAGLRGAVPIVLTTFPVVAGVAGARDALNIVFVLVVLFTLLQGPTLPAVARLTGVTRPDTLREVQVETAPLDVLDADLLTLTVPPGSRLHGVTVSELRLPHPTVVSLIVREGVSLVPDRGTVLRAGDELLLITTPEVREAAERRLRAVGRRGRLARWLGEQGAPESEPLLQVPTEKQHNAS
ncbi:potassium/proton antiporter [Streptomyces olivaceus]|uniref:Potassium/proton antiporter n=1 Tax=Streptomyces olivaceus TaxID=47716 RepID=A0ABS7W0S7_STROV|nr:potassium/proton antiporter [Streptomyces olivaceus]MBZ6088887.1 potassium/proton antiporter [Streptomyces olivaceus]MBZ6095739.1 potassium/proton antiporter [Streptomyces olivaceus]MBZ6117027.1 potassium/proton antiporter [Streptomyces olivaceus]MBZ6151559.1 potassium/proton antiporter [Streptomyces olivaceus]MBZ6298318.1 potassium/proton antiporter [Streptomyces olivaceus]